MRDKKSILKTSVLTMLAIAIIWTLYRYDVLNKEKFEAIRHYINSCGSFAEIVYILIFTLRTLFIIFPYSIMVVLGGSIFGPVNGFIYSMISVFLTATMAFFISRYFGKELVQKLLRGKIKELDSKVEEHGFKIILLMRISAIFPYDILNFAAGLTKVRYRDFILGTLLGVMPETFSLAFLGDNLENPFSPKFMVAVLLVALTVTIPFLYNKFKNKKKEY